MFAVDTTRAARWSASRLLGLMAALLAVVFVVSFTSLAGVARGATPSSRLNHSNAGTTTASAAVVAPKKAVIVVGPVGTETAKYIAAAKAIGAALAAGGVDVHYVLPPHATWLNVLAVANGADFFAYLGHGNGWPSPYGPFQENTKDGFGLNPTDGDTNYKDVAYYGRCWIVGGIDKSPNCTPGKNYKNGIHLAPNAIGLFNRLCYADGNGEPGMAVPTQTVAFQRADNFSSTLLAAGARTVFALGWQPGVDLASALVGTHQTMAGFFESRDAPNGDPNYLPYHGWVGYAPVKIASVRTPGATVYLDPDLAPAHKNGYLRAVTGDLNFTTDQWNGSANSSDTTIPDLTGLSGTQASNTMPADSSALTVFTPNGDGISDSLTIMHTLSEPSYLDVSIANSAGTVVRQFTSYTAAGTTSDTWDGKNTGGSLVNDGRFDIKVTPTDRAGNVGRPMTIGVMVMTVMRSPAAAPGLFYAADNDLLAQTQTQSVILDEPASLTWKVTQLDGTVVRTAMTNQTHAVGLVKWAWDGKNGSGVFVPSATYWMVVTADTAAGTYSHRIPVRAMPFKVTASASSGSVGTKITWTIVTAEPQTGSPKLSVKQPGLAKYAVTLLKVSTTKFKATIKLRAGGAPGTIVATLTGTDTGGGINTQGFHITLK
jgi:flagellar hook assembly protein FlgD